MWVADIKVNAVKASPVCVCVCFHIWSSRRYFWLLESDEDRREAESC